MSKTYLKVGSYTPETEDTEAVIDREYYRQGWIFKDEELFFITRIRSAMCRNFPTRAIPGRTFWICATGRRKLPASVSMR